MTATHIIHKSAQTIHDLDLSLSVDLSQDVLGESYELPSSVSTKLGRRLTYRIAVVNANRTLDESFEGWFVHHRGGANDNMLSWKMKRWREEMKKEKMGVTLNRRAV